MKELEISLSVEGGAITWNYEEIKKQVLDSRLEEVHCNTGQAAYYLGLKCNEFRSYIAQLEAVKERYINEYLQSVQAFHDQIDYVIEILKRQEENIDKCLDGYYEEARNEKKQRVIEYFYDRMLGYGKIADLIIGSEWFWEEEWLAKKMSNRKLYQSLNDKISSIVCDLETIKQKEESVQVPLLLYYAQCHDMQQVYAYYEQLTQVAKSLELQEVSEQTLTEKKMDYPEGQMQYRINANWKQIHQIEDYMQFVGASAVRTKNQMPKGICPHKELDFDSFVAVDLENSGSMGLANGDQPSEIIEIGAVRYVNGVCTETFSMLVNPGRPIVPMVQKLTGITDEMVKDKPSPEEAVKAFAQFAGDSIWLGHDLKNSDIPFLEKAARKCGIHFENEYFDTYEYARQIQEEEQFEKLRLGELAQHYGISTDHLHRACDDAELTAKLYLVMKNRKG